MVQLTEQFKIDLSESVVSEDDAVLQSVCLCGNVSKNGRTYPTRSFGDGSVYNDRPVFLNHGQNGPTDRDIRDIAGTIESAAITNGKPYGNIRFSELDAGSDLRKVAKSRLKNIGMSHVAQCNTNQDETVVEEVEKVISVDLVCFPATTKSLSEKVDDMSEKTVELLEKQLATMQSERDTFIKDGDAAIKELTEANAAFEKAAKEAVTTIEGLKEENQALKAEVDTFRTEKALAERRNEIGSELKEAELDPEDKVVVSDTFIESLMSEPDAGNRKSLIDDRKAVRESAGDTVVSQPRKSSNKSDFDRDKAFDEVFD